MDRLIGYAWPGNVRELQNVIERAVVLCADGALELDREVAVPALTASSLSPSRPARSPGVEEADGLDARLTDIQRAEIVAALAQARGLIEGPKGAARFLKLHPNTLRSRMEKLGIKRSAHEAS